MRARRGFTEEQKKELEEIEREISSLGEYRKYLTIRLRERLDMPTLGISEVTGYSEGAVRKIHARYFKDGKFCFKLKKKGGRIRETLSLTEEKNLLVQFESASAAGGTATIAKIKHEYESRIGRKVPKSTISRLLKRHGWRKILPRPYHPKKNEEAQNEFKKTSVHSSKGTRKHWAKSH